MMPPMIPLPEISSDANNISDAVRSLSIAEIKDHPSSYLDHDVQGLVAGFIKAKLDAAKGKRSLLLHAGMAPFIATYSSKVNLSTIFTNVVEDFSSAKLYKNGYESILKVSIMSHLCLYRAGVSCPT